MKSKIKLSASVLKFWKKYKRNPYIYAGLVVLVIILIAVIATASSHSNHALCSTATQNAVKNAPTTGSPAQKEKALNELVTQGSGCEAKKIISLNSSEEKLTMFNYYFNKATLEYRLGKENDAKDSAKKGIREYDKLSDIAKNDKVNKDQLKGLKDVEEGTY